MTIVYPLEQQTHESFVVGYRNYAGGRRIWSGSDTLEEAHERLAKARAEHANQPPATHRAHIPVTWYIERVTEIRRIELVTEVLASEPLPPRERT